MDPLETLHHLVGRHGEAMAWWQMSIRGVVIFLYGLLLVRLAGKRVFGRWGAIDIILSVVIGSNLSRAMTGSAPFLETLVASTVLVVLHGALVQAAVHVRWLGPLLKGRPVRLILDGTVDPHALRRHGVGENDLEAALRCAGLTGPQQVAEGWIERNGDISLIRKGSVSGPTRRPEEADGRTDQ